jgi:hypothetical protein
MDVLTRADILDWDSETLRDTAACHGLDVDDLDDAEVFTAFAEFLDDLEALVS